MVRVDGERTNRLTGDRAEGRKRDGGGTMAGVAGGSASHRPKAYNLRLEPVKGKCRKHHSGAPIIRQDDRYMLCTCATLHIDASARMERVRRMFGGGEY